MNKSPITIADKSQIQMYSQFDGIRYKALKVKLRMKRKDSADKAPA